MKKDLRDEPLVESAMKAASTHLGNHRRKSSGQLAIVHACNVAGIVKDEFGISHPTTLAVALLHDMLEDGACDRVTLRQQFGDDIETDIVALTKPRLKKKKARRLALFNSVIQGSERTVIVKLADFIDNLRHRRGTKRLHATRKGVLKFLNLLLQRPQTATIWKCVRALLTELRSQRSAPTALSLIPPLSTAASQDSSSETVTATSVRGPLLHVIPLNTITADHKMIA